MARTTKLLTWLALFLAPVAGWAAGSFSFSGTFTTDDGQQSYFFTLTQTRTVTLETTSYASGGFDPSLAVFDSAGNLIASNQDGGCALVAPNPATGFCFDAYLNITLPAGTYQVVVTESNNVANGPTLADSFAYAGQGNFTIGPESTGTGGFWDLSGVQLSPSYGISIQSADSAAPQLLISQQTPPGGQVTAAYSYQFTSSGGTAPYTWSLASGSLPPGLSLSAAGLVTGTPTGYGMFSFQVQVTDSSSPAMTGGPTTFQIVVVPQNLQILTSSLTTWVVNNAFTQTLSAIGGYTPLTWTITGTPGGLSVTSGGVVSGTPPSTGMFTVPVTVTDAQGNAVSQSFSWQVNPALAIISSATLPPGITNHAYPGFAFMATGGAAPVANIWTTVGGALPSGMTLTSAGAVQGTPPARGSYAFTAQVSDGIQPARQNATLTVYDPLTITATPVPAGVLGAAYGPYSLTATGGSGSYTWSGVNLPAGLTVSAAGQISGTPAAGGTASFTVNLADTAAAQTASAMFTILIGYPTLTISTSGNLGGVAVGTGISRSFSATGGKQPYRWSGSGLPPGLSIDGPSGTLSGVATAGGNYTFTIQVTDAQGTTAQVGGSLTVLAIISNASGVASTTASWFETFTASGGTPPYTFSATGIPGGFTFSSAGVLSGIAKTAGTYSFTVQVTDAAGISVSGSYALTVVAPANVTVSGAPLSNGIVGTPYSDTLGANGGVAPYTWAIIAGALPDGLTANSAGTVSGNPTKAGSFAFTARATDSTGASASGGVTISISPPALTGPSMSSLPNGVVGVNYPTQILTPTGGTPPYTYVLAGSPPPGITLTGGQLSGTPTAAGNPSFTVTISDSSNPPSTLKENLSILITNPASADLLISSSSLAFSLTTGAAGVPTGASVTVKSTQVQQILTYSVAITPAVSWLDVTGGGTTPGSIAIALDPSALSLPASDTPYAATIAVACIPPSPCTDTQTIQVSLSVSGPPPQLTLSTSLLAFSATTNNPLVPSQTLTLQNAGGGTLGIKSVSAADGFVTISGVPGSVAAGPGAGVSVGINTAGLNAGFYRSTISIVSSAGSASVPVTFYYAQNNSIFLSPSGEQFTSQAGSGPGVPPDSVVVSVAGSGTVHWSASVISGASWLSTNTPSGTSISASPGLLNFTLNSAAVAALAPQVYYGDIQVTSSDAVNSPQDFEVVLNVTAAAPAQPNPVPAGLVFVSSSGAAVSPRQETVFTSSNAPLGYQASASTSDGGNWLSVSPATGTTSTASPAQTMVAVDPSKLGPGVYTGGVSFALPGAAVRTVNVSLIVTAGTVTPQAVLTSKASGSCTPSKLVPTQTGLTNNFAQPVAWPVPLSIALFNDCGSPVVNGQMVATFSNGDPPLPLQTTDSSSGVYSGTWTPRTSSSQVTISARASASGYTTATAQLVGQVSPNAAPVLTPHGTLHVFDPLVGGALGPGNIVQIYGANLAAQTASATDIPLPTNLGGTSVIIGGVQVPLYFVSPGQINAQVPFSLAAGTSYQVLISANGALTTPDSIQISNTSPGIAALASGQIIAQHLDGSLVNDASPAAPGEYVVFYMAGLGLTDNPVVTGAASPSAVLARPLIMPSLTLGGENVPILFAGLTPGLVGLYQVNFQVPTDAANGDLSLVISQGGVASNTTVLAVQK